MSGSFGGFALQSLEGWDTTTSGCFLSSHGLPPYPGVSSRAAPDAHLPEAFPLLVLLRGVMGSEEEAQRWALKRAKDPGAAREAGNQGTGTGHEAQGRRQLAGFSPEHGR